MVPNDDDVFEKNNALGQSPTQNETRIDLGEDLLEKTAILIRGAPVIPEDTDEVKNIPTDPVEPEELFENAKILAQEGLIEDAKKALRELLRRHPNHLMAIQTLEGLQRQELKQIFGTEKVRKRYGQTLEKKPVEVDPDRVLRQLDQDLRLGIFSEGNSSATADGSAFLAETESQDAVFREVQSQLALGSVQDWIDMGVAFFEMGHLPLATRFFSGAVRRLDPGAVNHYQNRLSATGLLALTLIQDGKPFDALSELQPFLHDAEISSDDKVESYYLMGRIYEAVQKFGLAEHYFNEVFKAAPTYRDVGLRLLKISKQNSKGPV